MVGQLGVVVEIDINNVTAEIKRVEKMPCRKYLVPYLEPLKNLKEYPPAEKSM